MPVTINGIGTHYYGRGNASARRGTCEFCKRTTTLTSFDTRECFCILYIPLVPIAKYRIFDECSSCRKHRRIKASEFQQQVQSHIAPLREAVRQKPSDSAARQALIRELASMRMSTDAETAAREGVDALPNDPALNMLAGQILAGRGELPGAAAFLERAVHFDSANAESRLSLGRVLYFQGDYAAAARHLEEAHRLAPSDAVATYLLADSYTLAERWPDALAMWQQIPRPDRNVLRHIAECKKRLGYELHPAEKRAARTWWPFRRRRPARVKPVKPGTSSVVSGKRVLVGLVVVIAAFVIGGAALAMWGSKNADVYFDAVVARPTFVIDGEKLHSDVPLPWQKSVSPGKHNVVVLDAHGKQIESRTIEIEPQDAFSSDSKYIYNTAAQRVYRRDSIDYTADAKDAKYSYEFLGDSAFFNVRGVDYMFVPAPDTIELPSSSSRETKIALKHSDFTLHDYGVYRLQQNKAAEAESAFRHAVQFNPCDSNSRALLSAVLIGKGATDDGVAAAKEALSACPGSLIESHRVYQDALRRAGRSEEALTVYRAQLAQHRDSAAFHYLYGRIAPSVGEEMKEQREALRLDPTLARAHAALGYTLLGTGDYDNAMHEMAASIENGIDDDRATLHYVYAAIGAAKSDDAQALVESATKKRPYWTPRWLLALAGKKWTTAHSMYDQRAKLDPKSPITWWFGVQLSRLEGDAEALGKHLNAAERTHVLAAEGMTAKIEMLVDDGKWTEAIEAIDKAEESLGESRHVYHLYAAAASMLAGDQKAADKRLAQARESITSDDQLDGEQRQVMLAELAALDGSANADREMNELREDVLQLKHAWFFMGAHAKAAGDAAHAREYFQKSARASFDLQFPLLAAQRLAGS